MEWAVTLLGVAYVWTLPALASAGFARSGAHSISGFIETPGATGAMAVATAGPIALMVMLEATMRDADCCSELKLFARQSSFVMFLLGYGGFLSFNVNSYEMLHYGSVMLFALGFCIHAVQRHKDLGSSLAQAALVVGVIAFVAMIIMAYNDVTSMWFWATECIGFTMLLVFTPIEMHARKVRSQRFMVLVG
jgi:hypothetical protein